MVSRLQESTHNRPHQSPPVLFQWKNGCLLVILWTNYFLSSNAEMAGKRRKFYESDYFYLGHFL